LQHRKFFGGGGGGGGGGFVFIIGCVTGLGSSSGCETWVGSSSGCETWVGFSFISTIARRDTIKYYDNRSRNEYLVDQVELDHRL
jgi:hypothetical protein